jgi:hypothetical protein
MEFLQNNWFSILTVLILIGGLVKTSAKKDEKMQQIIDSVGKFEGKLDAAIRAFDEHVDTFNSHVADPDIHVNRNLRELFESRFKHIESGVDRLQKTLDKM